MSDSASLVTKSGPVPLLVTVTTLVTAARGDGIVNVSVRTPSTVATAPLVALVKVSVPVPAATPAPVSATGEPDGKMFVPLGAQYVQTADLRYGLPELNVRTASGHVCGNSDRTALAGAGNDFGFAANAQAQSPTAAKR